MIENALQDLESTDQQLDTTTRPKRMSDDAGAGIDAVIASIEFMLNNFLENLDQAIIDGNSLANVIYGNDSGNIISGGEGNDTIYGGAGDDWIAGDGGSDYLVGGTGDDLVSGADLLQSTVSGGVDVMELPGLRSAYTVTIAATDKSATVLNKSSGETDGLYDIERVRFSDFALALDLNGNAGTVAKVIGIIYGASSLTNKSYVGTGLDLVDGGMNEGTLVEYAADAKLGTAHTHTEFVRLVWTNLFGTAPTADQLTFWVGQLDSGSYTEASLGVFAADSAENAANINLTGLAAKGIAYLY